VKKHGECLHYRWSIYHNFRSGSCRKEVVGNRQLKAGKMGAFWYEEFAIRNICFLSRSSDISGSILFLMRGVRMFKEYMRKREKINKLRRVFQMMKLTKPVDFRGQKGEQFPLIQKMDFTEEKDTYIFTIPVGINPDLFEKNSFVLTQMYGEFHEITAISHEKTFLLTVHHKEPVKFPLYNYELDAVIKEVHKYKLPILLGKNEKGKYIFVDTMGENLPNILIGGSAGSGKSTQLRSILTTLITSKKHIHLHLADMKRAEFHLFRDCGCVKSYITRRRELIKLLHWLWDECENRSDLLENYGVFNIDQYNARKDVERKPYIVLCIDEFGVLRKEEKIQDMVTDIALMGRALGVFLILSLQRPDADAVDGDIKTNLNIRMAFRVPDKTNSNIILGTTDIDASKITQSGLMWASVGNQYMQIQAPYLEIESAQGILAPFNVPRTIEVVPSGEMIVQEPKKKSQGKKKAAIGEVTKKIKLDLLGGDKHESKR